MSHFLGTHQNKRDVKGRVSVPAPFRGALRDLAHPGTPALVLRRSHKLPCIEGWPGRAFGELAARLDRLDLFGEDHDDLAQTLYADAFPVESDKEGRIVLPDELVDHAGLGESVVFMGLGRTFQIWEPSAARRRQEEARARAREHSLTLPGAGVAGPAP